MDIYKFYNFENNTIKLKFYYALFLFKRPTY